MGKESVKRQGSRTPKNALIIVPWKALVEPSVTFFYFQLPPTFRSGTIVIIFRWQMLIRLAALVSAYKGPDATQTLSFFPETHFHNFQTTTRQRKLRRIVSEIVDNLQHQVIATCC
jgi:hypothetical protein